MDLCRVVSLIVSLAGFACGSDRSVATDGSLLLVLSSDLSIPGDIDRLSVEASQAGKTLLLEEHDLAEEALPMPATFVLRALSAREPVAIKVVAYRAGEARIERSARVTVPRAIVAELHLALSLVCDGTARVRGGQIVSTCPDGETCVLGSCAAQLIPNSEVTVSQATATPQPEAGPPHVADEPVAQTCRGAELEACGKCGTRTPSCDATTGTWSGWSACNEACADVGSSCPSGAYVSQAGGASTDRLCAPCPAEQFSVSDNAAVCVPWKTCAAGQYVAVEGSASRDRTCMDCPPGTFSMSRNSSSCMTHERCPPGTRPLAAGTATTPTLCGVCAVGQYCDGRADPRACGDGTWDHDRNPATACVAWTDCEAGYYIEATGTASADRVCEPCPSRTFSDRVNASQCLSVEWCPAGQVEIAPATPTTNILCAACQPGSYCAGAKAPAVACPEGTWDHDMNAASPCASWRLCEGMVVGEGGSALSDNVCACGPGQYVLIPGLAGVNPTCAACDGATYNPAGSLDAVACLPCPGNSAPNVDHTACL